MKTQAQFNEWIDEMQKAQAEARRVEKLNAPTTAENRRIRAENKIRENRKQEPLPTIPLPYKVNDWARRILKREAEHNAKLQEKEPSVWLADISQLKMPIRNRVACLVWWDYFGGRGGRDDMGRVLKDPWPHLDQYINTPYVEVPAKDLIMGLHAVGYSPWHAKKRATKANSV